MNGTFLGGFFDRYFFGLGGCWMLFQYVQIKLSNFGCAVIAMNTFVRFCVRKHVLAKVGYFNMGVVALGTFVKRCCCCCCSFHLYLIRISRRRQMVSNGEVVRQGESKYKRVRK